MAMKIQNIGGFRVFFGDPVFVYDHGILDRAYLKSRMKPEPSVNRYFYRKKYDET
jgi:hypothetical protein